MSHYIRSDGHLTDAALSAFVDKEEGTLDSSAEQHLNACESCLERLGGLATQLAYLDAELHAAVPRVRKAVPWRLVGSGVLLGVVGTALSIGDRVPVPSLQWLHPGLALLKQAYRLTSQPWFLGGCVALTVVCAAIGYKSSNLVRSK